MLSAVTRATVSVGPPAANGTIMVIGRFGKSWAEAARSSQNHQTKQVKRRASLSPP